MSRLTILSSFILSIVLFATLPTYGEGEQSLEQLTQAAEQGDAKAQAQLAFKYLFGLDVEKNKDKAIKLYLASAEQGDANAQGMLGTLYEKGNGVKQDYGKAMEWRLKASAQGKKSSQSALGRMYEKGLGVKKDLVQAVVWYEKAKGYRGVKEKLTTIYFQLGVMYANGKEVEKDEPQAMEWFHKAAEQEDMEAQYQLGKYYMGNYIDDQLRDNYNKSLKWLQKAKENGHPDNAKLITRLKKIRAIDERRNEIQEMQEGIDRVLKE